MPSAECGVRSTGLRSNRGRVDREDRVERVERVDTENREATDVLMRGAEWDTEHRFKRRS